MWEGDDLGGMLLSVASALQRSLKSRTPVIAAATCNLPSKRNWHQLFCWSWWDSGIGVEAIGRKKRGNRWKNKWFKVTRTQAHKSKRVCERFGKEFSRLEDIALTAQTAKILIANHNLGCKHSSESYLSACSNCRSLATKSFEYLKGAYTNSIFTTEDEIKISMRWQSRSMCHRSFQTRIIGVISNGNTVSSWKVISRRRTRLDLRRGWPINSRSKSSLSKSSLYGYLHSN
jgi:hypothetical protein